MDENVPSILVKIQQTDQLVEASHELQTLLSDPANYLDFSVLRVGYSRCTTQPPRTLSIMREALSSCAYLDISIMRLSLRLFLRRSALDSPFYFLPGLR